MRKRMVKTLAVLAAMLLSSSLVLAAPPANNAPAKSAGEAANAEKALTAGLEEMLTAALKNNPDIRVAEAKLHEAEAELNRTRLQVMQKVITFRHSLQTQRALVLEAEKNLKDVQAIYKKGLIPEANLREAQSAVEREKNKLATVEAEMPSLLGKLPQSVTQEKKAESGKKVDATNVFPTLTAYPGNLQPSPGWEGYAVQPWIGLQNQPFSTGTPWVVGNSVILQPFANDWFNNTLLRSDHLVWGQPLLAWHGVNTVAHQPAPGAMADKIRQALDTLVTLDIQDKPFGEALKTIQQKAPGIPFHKVLPEAFLKDKVTLQLEQVTLGAALQALEDSFPGTRNAGVALANDDALALAVRDYGILVTLKYQLPSHATLLYDFWKKPPAKEAAKANPSGGESNSPVDKNPPAADVEGVIKATDPKTGYVTISLGTDAGVAKGNTLEVYRLKPQPQYLGTLRILEAHATESVGKLISKPRSLQVGDQVASQRAY